ncbi:UNVERIFIED_CONTAM: hypothetical protein GTU68_045117 [Idotea baltica]|nr:hypothetical protein [Idotea baltica]
MLIKLLIASAKYFLISNRN